MNLLDHFLIGIAPFTDPYPMKLAFEIADVLPLDPWCMLSLVALSIFAVTILAVLFIYFCTKLKVKPRTNAVVGIHR